MKRMGFVLSAMAVTAMTALSLSGCGGENGSASETFANGTYQVDAQLSCYVSAMGGIEFGGPLMTGCELIKQDEQYTLKLSFSKSSVTIYSITCYTFVNVTPTTSRAYYSMKAGTIGYYKADGMFTTDGVSYTLSEDTAPDPMETAVHYVESVTIPVDELKGEYRLSLYIDSNVMGVQFCEASSITDGGNANYPAILMLNLESIRESK
jgi:hypothetical protein